MKFGFGFGCNKKQVFFFMSIPHVDTDYAEPFFSQSVTLMDNRTSHIYIVIGVWYCTIPQTG